ncbi:TPA: hypothetical protein PTW06_003626 [Clostridium botulinum]|nr:hypothetical protein [Clostridium botulinum]HDK7226297.1 hypothetical protein [Clostridium botulinum]HDK7273687.1 hypothetical protein [Clostridium botulinum]HDK7307035.1 hypothetical protein [Clostridium botulinum]
MIKIYDYVIYIRDMYKFRQICKRIDEICNYKHQYKFDTSPTGSVTSSYTFEEEKVLYNANHWCRYTKSILSCLSIYKEQKQGIQYLIDNQDKYKDIYNFINDEVAEELRRDFPKINEYEDKWSWGSELVEYYDEGYSYDNPRVREIDYDLITLECNECYREFTICGNEYEMDGEKVQCPYCKSELKIGVEYEPILTTEKVN